MGDGRAAMRALECRGSRARARCTDAQEKNVSADLLDGRVGRIYMPKQDVGGMALHKMKARRPAWSADRRSLSQDCHKCLSQNCAVWLSSAA
jgi:hypothetical protein